MVAIQHPAARLAREEEEEHEPAPARHAPREVLILIANLRRACKGMWKELARPFLATLPLGATVVHVMRPRLSHIADGSAGSGFLLNASSFPSSARARYGASGGPAACGDVQAGGPPL